MKCSHCEEQALFKCSCDQPYFCELHLGRHLASMRNHPFEIIDVAIEDKKLKKSKLKILKRLEKIEEAKAQITSKSKALISLIEELNREAIQKLDVNAKKLFHLFEQEKYCLSEVSDLDKFDKEEMIVNSVYLEGICEELKTIYQKDLVSNMKISKFRREKFFDEHSGGILCGVVTGDGKLVVTGGEDSIIRGWDLNEKKQKFTLKGHNSDVRCIAISENSKFIASGSLDFSVQVWNIQSKTQVAVLLGNTSEVSSVCFLKSQSLIVFINISGEVKVWNFIENKITQTKNTGNQSFCFLMLNNQSTFVIGAISVINFYALENNNGPQPVPPHYYYGSPVNYGQIKSLSGHGDAICCITITVDENVMVSGSKDSLIIIWDLSINQAKFNLRGSNGAINSLVLTSDEQYLLSASSDKTVRQWSMKTGNQIKIFKDLLASALCILKRKDDFLLLSYDSKIGTFNTNDQNIEMNSYLKNYKLGSETSDFDKKFIGFGRENYAEILELKNDRPKYCLETNNQQITCVELSFDQNFAISCSEGKEKNLFLWNLKEGRFIGELKGHTDSVLCASFSIDSVYAASGSSDASVRLWNLQTFKEEFNFQGHSAAVTSVKFMSNREMLVSCGKDNLIIIWNLISKTLQRNSGVSSITYKIIVTQDNRFIVSCSPGNGIQIWNVQSMNQESSFIREDDAKKWINENKISMKLVRRYLKL